LPLNQLPRKGLVLSVREAGSKSPWGDQGEFLATQGEKEGGSLFSNLRRDRDAPSPSRDLCRSWGKLRMTSKQSGGSSNYWRKETSQCSIFGGIFKDDLGCPGRKRSSSSLSTSEVFIKESIGIDSENVSRRQVDNRDSEKAGKK